MRNARKWFPSQSSRKAAVLLSAGVFIVFVATMFIYSVFVYTQSQRPTIGQVSHDFSRAVKLSQSLENVKSNISWLHGRGFYISVVDKMDPKATLITDLSRKKLDQLVYKSFPNFRYAVALPYGGWLLIVSRPYPHLWLFGFGAVGISLLVALIFLCVWSIRYVAAPLDDFIIAAKRFGRDVQAPPMAVSGDRETQQVIRAFNDMQSQIKRLVMDRTQMLAAISHDLRTPITRLQLRAEYLHGTPQYEKAIKDLDEMDQMIRSILSFARDYTTAEPMERFDINALLASICDDMSDTGKPTEYHSAASSVVYFGRIMALRRVFTNIIENAIKYGDIAIVALEKKEKHLIIKIEDRGEGIPEEQMDKVFEPFYRIDPARTPEKGGSGLGLAVARDIVRAHGGDISLSNMAGSGGLIVLVRLSIN